MGADMSLVGIAVFKTVVFYHKMEEVGSIPTRSRQIQYPCVSSDISVNFESCS